MLRRLRAIFLGIALLTGAFIGVPMRPEDIEKLLNVHTRVRAEQSIRKEAADDKK